MKINNDLYLKKKKNMTQMSRFLIVVIKFFVFFFSLNFLQHDLSTENPLKYTHLDIAGSATEVPETANAVTICALAKRFFGKIFEENHLANPK